MKIINILCFLAFSASVQAQTVVKGTVKDESNLPLDAASISLVKGTDTTGFKNGATDKNGNFSFSGIPSGTYFIRVTAIGHASLSGTGLYLKSGPERNGPARFHS